jgi:phosphatidate cytidylyltransferase
VNLGVRVASAAVLLAVLLGALWLGGVAFDVVIGVAIAIGLAEFAQLAKRAGAAPPPGVLFPLAGWLLYRFLLPGDLPALEWGLGVATVFGLVAGTLLGGAGVVRWAVAVGGALYLGLCAGYYLALLRWRMPDPDHQGLRIVLTTLGSAMIGDTAALFVGSAVGRAPFFPAISPHKTLEGAAAGFAVTTAGFALVAPSLFGLRWYHAVLLGALVGVAAQAGDLVESALKRSAGEKDSSRLIPGHGGLLDRLDSLVFLGPVVYCYLRLVSLA